MRFDEQQLNQRIYSRHTPIPSHLMFSLLTNTNIINLPGGFIKFHACLLDDGLMTMITGPARA